MEILFKQQLNGYQITELKKRLPFLTEVRLSYNIFFRDDVAYGMSITADEDMDTDELSELIGELLEDIYQIKDIPSRVVWETEKNPVRCTLRQLMSSGMIYENTNGQLTLCGEILDLFDALDVLFSTISQHLFQCRSYRFPVLLPTKTLEVTGYFEHNPHQWMNVHRLSRGTRNYRRYTGGQKEQDGYSPDMTDTRFSLPPTMCYYVYDMLKNKAVDNSSYTACGRSFRYEGNHDLPFERLIDFTIRETVFLGTKEYVETAVDRYMQCVTAVMELLGVSGRCETANDMFFMTDRTAQRLNIQKMLGNKYELLLYIPEDGMVAAASFNKHGNFIGKRFHIQAKAAPGETAFSSCIGIGLERLIYACVTQVGLDQISSLTRQVRDTESVIGKLRNLGLTGNAND